MVASTPINACELKNKLRIAGLALAFAVAVSANAPARATSVANVGASASPALSADDAVNVVASASSALSADDVVNVVASAPSASSADDVVNAVASAPSADDAVNVIASAPSAFSADDVVNVVASASSAFSADGVVSADNQTQPDHSQPSTDEAAPGIAAEPSEHAEGEEEHGSIWAGLLWPTINFAILFGGLWYLLATPLATYLKDRHTAIRRDLVDAAAVSATAQSQLAELDRKLQALPGEIEALRQRGAEEITAEEARIAKLAAAERERLLEQTRREIDLQLRLAKRDLVEHTADLAVQLAGTRIAQQMTPGDQDRLVDRYLNTVNPERAS